MLTKPLEIGKTYLRGDGSTATVAGPTKDNQEWVYTVQGDWYRQSDGRYISYNQKQGRSVPMDAPTWRDIVDEAVAVELSDSPSP